MTASELAQEIHDTVLHALQRRELQDVRIQFTTNQREDCVSVELGPKRFVTVYKPGWRRSNASNA